MSRTKLALYLGNFDLKNGYASVARIFNIAILLKKNGFLTIAPCFRAEKQLFEKQFGADSCLSIIERPPVSKKKLYLDYVYYLKIISDTHPDVVFLYDFPSIPMKHVLGHCRRNKIPVISDCTEWYDSKCVNGVFSKIFKVVDVFFRMHILNKRADGIICVSDYLKRHYSKYNSVKIPPLMEHINSFSTDNKVSRVGENINIFYAGNTNKSKDYVIGFLKWLIKNEPDNVFFHVFGNNNSDIQCYLTTLFSKQHILLYGNLEHNDLLDKIKSFDCELIIRRNSRANRAGFPSKYAESVILGIPCFVTNVGDVGTLVVDSFNGFLTNWKKVDYSLFVDKLKNTDFANMKKNVISNRELFLTNTYLNVFEEFLKKAGVL